MRCCLEFFKGVMGAMQPEAFVIDKDVIELNVLEEVFPEKRWETLHTTLRGHCMRTLSLEHIATCCIDALLTFSCVQRRCYYVNFTPWRFREGCARHSTISKRINVT